MMPPPVIGKGTYHPSNALTSPAPAMEVMDESSLC